MGVDVETKYGGTGFNFFQTILVIEELAKCDPSVSIIVDVQNTLISQTFHRFASEEQKKKYLPRICKDTVSSCNFISYSYFKRKKIVNSYLGRFFLSF